MTTIRIHRDIYPETDHGYTWVECFWFERDGRRISPTIPGAGGTERLGHMPGGPITSHPWEEEKHYCNGKADRLEKTEATHKGHWYVGSVCISQDRGAER